VRHGGTSSASHASSLSYLATDTTARKYSHKLTAFIATIDAQVLETHIAAMAPPVERRSHAEVERERSKRRRAKATDEQRSAERERSKRRRAQATDLQKAGARAFAARVARRVLPDATRDRGSERAELSTLSNMPPLDAKLHSEIAQWGLKLVNVHHVLGSNDCVDPRWREAARRAGRSRACRQQQG